MYKIKSFQNMVDMDAFANALNIAGVLYATYKIRFHNAPETLLVVYPVVENGFHSLWEPIAPMFPNYPVSSFKPSKQHFSGTYVAYEGTPEMCLAWNDDLGHGRYLSIYFWNKPIG